MSDQSSTTEPRLDAADATAAMAASGAEQAATVQPSLVTIVSGQPDPEELAALVAVLSSIGGGAPEPEAPRSAWSDPSRRLGDPRPRRGGWRSSGLPR